MGGQDQEEEDDNEFQSQNEEGLEAPYGIQTHSMHNLAGLQQEPHNWQEDLERQQKLARLASGGPHYYDDEDDHDDDRQDYLQWLKQSQR